MQQKIQNFVFLCEQIISENGELKLRKSWSKLNESAIELAPYMRQLTQNFAPKYALLFLLSCENDSNQKRNCFSGLFRKILENIPSLDLFNILNLMNKNELNTYLLPFLYEGGNIGSVAVYLAARLGLKIKNDSFEFFLNSREWSQEDLVNLSYLVISNEKDDLILNLDETYKISSNENIGSFLNVLNSDNIKEPVQPKLIFEDGIISDKSNIKVTTSKVSHNKPSDKVNSKKESASNIKKSNFNIFVSKNNSEIKTGFPDTQSKTNTKSNDANLNISKTQTAEPKNPNTANTNIIPLNNEAESNDASSNDLKEEKLTKQEILNKATEKFQSFIGIIKDKLDDVSTTRISVPNTKTSINKNYILIGVLVFVSALVLIVGISNMNSFDTGSAKIPPKEGKIPEYWVDAITNKHLTPSYLQADVDYRMGELYLARGLYNEANSFFQSALKIEPKHNIARMRLGYSELLQGNTSSAKSYLTEVLKNDSKLQNLNLYLARVFVSEKNSKIAIEHYKDEFKIHNELNVGMELANYYATIGDSNSAMDLISKLQEKFPDKMLVLDANKDSKN